MRTLVIILAVALLALATAGAVASWEYSKHFPKPSQETAQLNVQKRHALSLLRAETKFEPHDYPPLGYTGIATPEDGTVARAAVNDVIDTILSRADGPVSAKTVSDLIGESMKRVDLLETEDRDRTADYMVEIWYLLGFKGATGRFAYGGGLPRPGDYGEPLPPGWKSPAKPRPIGEK